MNPPRGGFGASLICKLILMPFDVAWQISQFHNETHDFSPVPRTKCTDNRETIRTKVKLNIIYTIPTAMIRKKKGADVRPISPPDQILWTKTNQYSHAYGVREIREVSRKISRGRGISIENWLQPDTISDQRTEKKEFRAAAVSSNSSIPREQVAKSSFPFGERQMHLELADQLCAMPTICISL